MEEARVTRFPRPFGRIPNFVGAESAAQKLCATDAFEKAKTVFCCPDSPQRSVRLNILRAGKILVMASPRLREDFILLDSTRISSEHYMEASTIEGAFKYGRRVGPHDIVVDFKVTGSVAVTLDGGRVGKGGGYSDLEYGLLREFRCISEATLVGTTVHDLQVVVWLPMDPSHDMPLDLIATPTRLVKTVTRFPKPKGINWFLLSEQQVQDIPLLRELKRQSRRQG
jgi:5-formyltetrahydrofolate cyclo-ligase